MLRAQIDVMVLAMACGKTKVGTIPCSQHTSELITSRTPGSAMYDPNHDMRSPQASRYGASHNRDSREFSDFVAQRQWFVSQFAYLLERLAATRFARPGRHAHNAAMPPRDPTRPRPSFAALLLSLLLATPLAAEEAEAPVAPPEPAATQDLSLLLLGGFKGDFGLPDCRAEGGASVRPSTYPRLVAAVARMRAERSAAGQADPLILHAGDLHYPGSLPGYLLGASERGVQDLLGLGAAIPYDAISLGGLDLSLPSAALAPFFTQAAEAFVPFQAVNIGCEAGSPGEPICEALGTNEGGTAFRVVERGALRIALVSALDPAHLPEISAQKRQGITLRDLASSVAPVVKQIRDEDLADLVVVQFHPRGALEEAALLKTLPKLAGVDLLVLKQQRTGVWGALEGPDMGWSVVPGTGTVVLPAGRGVSQAVVVELTATRDEAGWHAVPRSAVAVDASAEEPDPELTARIDELGQAYCADWGQAIQPAVPLASPMDQDGFARFVLDVMRDESRAEIALLNAGTLRNTSLLPIPDHVTRSDLHALLPFGGNLVQATLSGSDLYFLASSLGTDVLATGLERVGGALKVNGRAIEPDRRYTVVMNRFVADGGDSLVSPSDLKQRRPLGGDRPVELVDLLIQAVAERRFVSKKTGKLDPAAKHVDLHTRPVWRFAGALNVSYSKIAVENPLVDGVPAYSKGELTNISADLLHFDTRLGIDADTRDHLFAANLVMQYSLARYAEEYGGVLETSDWIRGNLVYDYAGLRSLSGGKGYVPMPFAELQVQSEFDVPDERDWHRLELTGIAGIKLKPVEPLSFQVGVNVRGELLDPDAEALPGLAVGYTLRRFNLFKIKTSPVQLESDTSWFYNDIGNTDVHEIRHFTRLYLGLLDRLFFTARVSAYAYREGPVDAWGAYADFTIGLSVAMTNSIQAL